MATAKWAQRLVGRRWAEVEGVSGVGGGQGGLMRRSAGRLAKWDCHSSPAGANSKNASEALRGEWEGRKREEWVKKRKEEGKKGRRGKEGSERGESNSLESTWSVIQAEEEEAGGSFAAAITLSGSPGGGWRVVGGGGKVVCINTHKYKRARTLPCVLWKHFVICQDLCVAHHTTGTLTSAAACRKVVSHDVKTWWAKGRLVLLLIYTWPPAPQSGFGFLIRFILFGFYIVCRFFCPAHLSRQERWTVTRAEKKSWLTNLSVLWEPPAFKETWSSGRFDQDANWSVWSKYRGGSQTLFCCNSSFFYCRGNYLILSSFHHQLLEKKPVSGFLRKFELV